MAERISFPMETFGLGVPQSRLSCSYKRTFTKHGEWEKCLVLLLQRLAARGLADDPLDGSIVVEEAGLRSSHVKAYQHRGELLLGLYLYDYVSLVRLKRDSNDGSCAGWGEAPVEDGRPPGRRWVQVLRRPGKQATVCLDGYLSRDFAHDDEDSCRRGIAAVQQLALTYLYHGSSSCAKKWATSTASGRGRERRWLREYDVSSITCNCFDDQPKRQNATPSDGHPPPEMAIRRSDTWVRTDDAGAESTVTYQSNSIGNATRQIDVVRGAEDSNQMAAKSPELMAMMQQLCRFQQSVLCSTAELEAAVVTRTWGETDKAIKSQQMSASKERERMIHGIPVQDITVVREGDRRAAALHRGESLPATGRTIRRRGGNASPIWPISPFLGDGQRSIAFSIICHQLCQFVGGFEGGTGESQIIEAFVELFSRWSLSNRTAAARINSITIHSRFSKDQGAAANTARDVDEVRLTSKLSDGGELLQPHDRVMVKPRDWRRGWHDRITNCCRDENLGVSLLHPSAAAWFGAAMLLRANNELLRKSTPR
ncbi:PIF1-like helicase [Hirsutella rhossiliensis]